MIDFLIGVVVGGAAVYAFFHFRGQPPAKLTDFLSTLDLRIKTMLSDAFNQALARLESTVDDKINGAASAGAQVDAEAIAAVSALADKFAAPPAE